MIQIIAGTFGYYNGRKVVPITNADGPQKFDPELEARLVKQGVAKYVDEQPVAPAPAAKPEQEPEAAPEADDAPAAPEYDEDMKLDELKEVRPPMAWTPLPCARRPMSSPPSRRRRQRPTRPTTTRPATMRSPLRSAPRIPSNGLRLQENGR